MTEQILCKTVTTSAWLIFAVMWAMLLTYDGDDKWWFKAFMWLLVILITTLIVSAIILIIWI